MNRTEEVASKAAGAMKAVKATVKGLSGVFKQLTREHGEIAALLMRVKLTSDPQIRRDMYPTIRSELLSHERGELLEVYPVFVQYGELEGIVRAHEQEAGQLEQILSELSSMAYDDRAWAPTFGRLMEMFAQHTRTEESDYFPKANRILGNDVADRMRESYERTRADLRRRSP